MHHKCDVLFTFCEVFPEVCFYSMKKCTKLVFLEENSKKSDLFILITLNEGKNLSLTMQVLITYTFYIHKISCGLYFWASDQSIRHSYLPPCQPYDNRGLRSGNSFYVILNKKEIWRLVHFLLYLRDFSFPEKLVEIEIRVNGK